MKNLKHIILVILTLVLSIGSLTNLVGQKSNIAFIETYTLREITSLLDPGDALFKMIAVDPLNPDGPDLGSCENEMVDKVWKHIHSDGFANQLPGDVRFAWRAHGRERQMTLLAFKMTGKSKKGPTQNDIQEVTSKKDERNGSYCIYISFTKEGAEKWADLTADCVGRNLAIVIDGKVVAAPKVQEEIKNGKCMITGNFSKTEAVELQVMLGEI